MERTSAADGAPAEGEYAAMPALRRIGGGLPKCPCAGWAALPDPPPIPKPPRRLLVGLGPWLMTGDRRPEAA